MAKIRRFVRYSKVFLRSFVRFSNELLYDLVRFSKILRLETISYTLLCTFQGADMWPMCTFKGANTAFWEDRVYAILPKIQRFHPFALMCIGISSASFTVPSTKMLWSDPMLSISPSVLSTKSW